MAGRMFRISIGMIIILLLFACGKEGTKEKKISDLDFTVVAPAEISEELMPHIEEKKEDVFTLIYKDGEHMYLIIGYGQQSGGGYSIKVNELYLGETSVYVSTSLEGPEKKDEKQDAVSFPYIVLKMEMLDRPVIFDM